MRRQGSGRIINIGSILGVVPLPYVALYAASKHAVEGYTGALDHELRTQGIRVSVIEPAYIKTQFEANNREADAKLEEYDLIRAKLTKVVSKAMAEAESPELWLRWWLKRPRLYGPRSATRQDRWPVN
ncbi:short chain dehydrogenase [Klebsiella michiganensis]|uniref:Short chain dehydrogenase n=1 Tax=Klebsiella michiganensis TaxID=1134687 RepID=A0A7H4LVR1_9ENTR|nr:short chain dehydrogenase [Klebsiella michiganensis]